jgi:signal transduction histidine kinase
VRNARLRTLGWRWVHLLRGGALLMPFFLLTSTALAVARPDADTVRGAGWQLAAFALALPPAAVAGLLLPALRPLEAAAARTLGRPRRPLPEAGPSGDGAARWRTAVWFTQHVALGGLTGAVTLAVPPAVVVLGLYPFVPSLRHSRWGQSWPLLPDLPWAAPPVGAALLGALLAAVAGAGALQARLAPALLGPTPADRLAAAEERAAELAVRNRLARELHDSVGHALSAVSLQAAAARRVLDGDPAFAREALAAIEATARDAVAELDGVLGLLREDDVASAAPAPTLADLDALLDRTRAAGLAVAAEVTGVARVPGVVSREAYRIVQEGLTNAARHAGRGPVRLRLTADRDAGLTITLENPLPPAAAPARPGGGSGLRGVAQRAAVLGGDAHWQAADGVWRLVARLPLGAAAR